MTRVPPIVFPSVALLALVVAIVGLVSGWAEATPVAFFAFVFCSILAAMHMYLTTTEPYVPSTTEDSPVTLRDSDEQDQGVSDAPRHMEVIPVADDNLGPSDAAPDESPQRPA